LQVKLCDPCLSALYVPWCKKPLYKYSSFPLTTSLLNSLTSSLNSSTRRPHQPTSIIHETCFVYLPLPHTLSAAESNAASSLSASDCVESSPSRSKLLTFSPNIIPQCCLPHTSLSHLHVRQTQAAGVHRSSSSMIPIATALSQPCT